MLADLWAFKSRRGFYCWSCQVCFYFRVCQMIQALTSMPQVNGYTVVDYANPFSTDDIKCGGSPTHLTGYLVMLLMYTFSDANFINLSHVFRTLRLRRALNDLLIRAVVTHICAHPSQQTERIHNVQTLQMSVPKICIRCLFRTFLGQHLRGWSVHKATSWPFLILGYKSWGFFFRLGDCSIIHCHFTCLPWRRRTFLPLSPQRDVI